VLDRLEPRRVETAVYEGPAGRESLDETYEPRIRLACLRPQEYCSQALQSGFPVLVVGNHHVRAKFRSYALGGHKSERCSDMEAEALKMDR